MVYKPILNLIFLFKKKMKIDKNNLFYAFKELKKNSRLIYAFYCDTVYGQIMVHS